MSFCDGKWLAAHCQSEPTWDNFPNTWLRKRQTGGQLSGEAWALLTQLLEPQGECRELLVSFPGSALGLQGTSLAADQPEAGGEEPRKGGMLSKA